jgi:hypothetical protein
VAGGTPGKRFALPDSRVLIHQPHGGIQGQSTDIEIAVRDMVEVRRRMIEALASDTGQSVERITADIDRDYTVRGPTPSPTASSTTSWRSRSRCPSTHCGDQRVRSIGARSASTGDDGAMGFDVNRWVKYARARIDAAVGQGHEELDRREAEREAELAERPWLAADGSAPSLDEARARIRWEAERQERAAARGDAASGPDAPDERGGTTAPGPAGAADSPADGDAGPDPRGAGPRDPAERARDAEREGARIELEERSRQAADRLAQIRRELGVDGPDA